MLMSTDCPDDMLSENIYIKTPESIVKKKNTQLLTAFQPYFPTNEQEVCQ